MKNNPFAKGDPLHLITPNKPKEVKAEKIKIELKHDIKEDPEAERKMILMSYGSDEGNIPKSHRYWQIRP